MDFTVMGPVLTGDHATGVVAGVNYGRIWNVKVMGGTITGGSASGAIAGWNQGTIEDTESDANVNGRTAVGGVAGVNMGVVTNANVTGGELMGNSSVGGVAGDNYGIIEGGMSGAKPAGASRVAETVGTNLGGIVR
jgi:hypothetical protein